MKDCITYPVVSEAMIEALELFRQLPPDAQEEFIAHPREVCAKKEDLHA